MTSTNIPVAERQGSLAFTRPPLLIYDLSVLWFSNTFVWKCPTTLILDFYNQHVASRHLEVGVGTGYFLDKCRFPVPVPDITLVDLSRDSLHLSASRINRYQPHTICANVLQPLPLDTPFESIGMNYVLHCLPGTMRDKAAVFRHLQSLLSNDGVLFGTTILGKDVPQGVLARSFNNTYNRTGIFSNLEDGTAELRTMLQRHFRVVTLDVVGCVAFFSARNPVRT
jgi:SAM-dependent methyltransferase